jgi:hypothetical protein
MNNAGEWSPSAVRQVRLSDRFKKPGFFPGFFYLIAVTHTLCYEETI